MKGDGGNNRSYKVWAASLLLGELMSYMKIKSLAPEPCVKMLSLVFFLAGCQQVLENRMHGGMGFALDDARPTRCYLISFFETEQTFQARKIQWLWSACLP